ncbi:hypothetical protein OIO90_005151 [Microbotryomycetes sp. JL221]|nr:hypothetical protein OIO90_005151 [Microbotryomycetes sp. JL221]
MAKRSSYRDPLANIEFGSMYIKWDDNVDPCTSFRPLWNDHSFSRTPVERPLKKLKRHQSFATLAIDRLPPIPKQDVDELNQLPSPAPTLSTYDTLSPCSISTGSSFDDLEPPMFLNPASISRVQAAPDHLNIVSSSLTTRTKTRNNKQDLKQWQPVETSPFWAVASLIDHEVCLQQSQLQPKTASQAYLDCLELESNKSHDIMKRQRECGNLIWPNSPPLTDSSEWDSEDVSSSW